MQKILTGYYLVHFPLVPGNVYCTPKEEKGCQSGYQCADDKGVLQSLIKRNYV